MDASTIDQSIATEWRRPHFEILGSTASHDELARELYLKATRIRFVAVVRARAGREA